MKKHFPLIALISSAVLLFSCSKQNDPGSNGTVNNDLKIKTWADNSGVATYSYDASGRCTQELYSNGSKTTFEYNAGVVTEKSYNTAGVNDYTYTYQLNSDGLAITETRPFSPSFSSTRIYNSDKQEIKEITSNNGQASGIDYFYSNGNCDSSRFTTNGNWNSTAVYTYYTDQFNSIGSEAEGQTFYGKDSKNLLKSEIYRYPNGTDNGMTNYSYEFDSKGRVTKETSSHNGNLDISFLTFF